MQYPAHVHRSLSAGTLPVHQMRWDWGFIIICVKICKSLFSEDKCVLILPILDPYSSHMTLPMWVQHGTLLQIPHESLMGCPYRTHINTHLGPMWVLYFLLAGLCMVYGKGVKNRFGLYLDCGYHKAQMRAWQRSHRAFVVEFKRLAAIEIPI